MTDVVVNGKDVAEALLDGMSKNRSLRRAAGDFIDDAAATWKEVWEETVKGVSATGADPHPYETGNYVAHIKKRKLTFREKINIKKALANGVLIGGVYNDADDANFIEEGTKADKPGGHANWVGLDGVRRWGPNTPTPAFHIAKRTTERMNGKFNVR